MTRDSVYDLVIVGGGMVGASLAIALAGRGLRMAPDRGVSAGAEDQPSYDDRAIALAYGSEPHLRGRRRMARDARLGRADPRYTYRIAVTSVSPG